MEIDEHIREKYCMILSIMVFSWLKEFLLLGNTERNIWFPSTLCCVGPSQTFYTLHSVLKSARRCPRLQGWWPQLGWVWLIPIRGSLTTKAGQPSHCICSRLLVWRLGIPSSLFIRFQLQGQMTLFRPDYIEDWFSSICRLLWMKIPSFRYKL